MESHQEADQRSPSGDVERCAHRHALKGDRCDDGANFPTGGRDTLRGSSRERVISTAAEELNNLFAHTLAATYMEQCSTTCRVHFACVTSH